MALPHRGSELRQTGRTEPHQIGDGFDVKTGSFPGHQTSHGTLPELPKYQKHCGELGAAYPFLVTVQNERVAFGTLSELG